MTKEEAIETLKRMSPLSSALMPSPQQAIDAVNMAIAALSIELPQGLDEAAEKYSENILANNEDLQDAIEDAFKEGAEWMAKQGGLTISDIEKLHTFLYAVKNNKQGAFTFTRLSNEQYEEVLQRFNNAKKEKAK